MKMYKNFFYSEWLRPGFCRTLDEKRGEAFGVGAAASSEEHIHRKPSRKNISPLVVPYLLKYFNSSHTTTYVSPISTGKNSHVEHNREGEGNGLYLRWGRGMVSGPCLVLGALEIPFNWYSGRRLEG